MLVVIQNGESGNRSPSCIVLVMMGIRSVVAVLVVCVALAASGCGGGAGDEKPTSADPSASSAPGLLVEGCPNFVTDVSSGPESIDISGNESLSQAQNRLQGDLERAMGYAESHRDEFGSIRFENSPRVRLVLGFTGHLDEHCGALRNLLESPDEFEIFEAEVTEANLRAIQDDIVQMASEYQNSVGSGSASGVVAVNLRADGEAVAAEILERYGDLVDITVGALSYPDRGRVGGLPCGLTLPSPSPDATDLIATLELFDAEVAAGVDYRGVATITNGGESDVEFESGSPLIGFVFLPGGVDVVGVLTSNVAGVSVGTDLAPGESIDVEVIGGTASCDPDLGYALPPGNYEVRAAIENYERPNGQFELRGLLTEAARLEVTP